MNAGLYGGGDTSARKMSGPGGTLNYSIFRDSARTENWGNTAADELTGAGNGPISVYASVPAGQYVSPGTYTDTVSTATRTMNVSVVVQPTCLITATPLAFGNYAALALNSTSTVTVTCTNTTAYNVGLSAGLAPGATVTTRAMKGPGTNYLSYQMYKDSGRTINWGNTVGTDTVAGSGNGIAQPLTVYGQIPGGKFPAPGAYTDTIVATVTY
jgi:spore coat protein U-like protein